MADFQLIITTVQAFAWQPEAFNEPQWFLDALSSGFAYIVVTNPAFDNIQQRRDSMRLTLEGEEHLPPGEPGDFVTRRDLGGGEFQLRHLSPTVFNDNFEPIP